MTLHTIFDYLKRHRLLTAVSIIGLALALFAVNHSTVKRTEPLLLSTSIASAQASGISGPVPQAAELTSAPAAPRFPAVTFGERDDATDGSRECAPDNGVGVACIYN